VQLSERAREPGEPRARAGLERAVQDQLQSRLDEQVREHFPDDAVQRVALLQYGDDPWVEPGDLLVRVFLEEAEEEPPLRAWGAAHEAALRELHRELAEQLPGARYLDSGSARTAVRAGPCGGSVARRMTQPGANATSPRSMSDSDRRTWRCWTR
jgi:hypothetical protein